MNEENDMDPKKQAYSVFITYSIFSQAFMTLVFTVNMIYFVVTAKLTPLEMVLVGTALELTIFLFEVPTGVVADTISRKLSIVIGVFLIGIGFLIQAFFPVFFMIIIAQIFWGVGYTFTSGALQAWITDEIGEEKAATAFLRATQLEQVGGLVAIGLSILTATLWGMKIPMVLGGLLFFLLGFYLLIYMKEHEYNLTKDEHPIGFSDLKNTLKNGIRMLKIRPALIRILLVGFFYGLYSEGLDRLWVPHVIERYQLPEQGQSVMIGWIGGLNAASMLAIFFIAGTARKFFEKSVSTTRITNFLSFFSILLVLSLGLFAVMRNIWLSFGLLILIGVLRALIYPLFTAWVNQRLNSNSRATVLSMSSLVDAFGQIGGGPMVGLVAQNNSIQAGLLFSTILLSPVIGLLLANKNNSLEV